MLKYIYRRPPKINAAYFIVTEQCNLRCTYCYEQHGVERMTKEVAIAGVDFLFRQGTSKLDIFWFGGEPTLETPLIISAMSHAMKLNFEHHKDLHFGMVTNCTNLPDEFASFLREAGQKYHIDVQLSIDGKEEVQDMYRVRPDGSGSWNSVSPTLDKWKKLAEETPNLRISVHGCLNKRTLGRLYETYLYFREERGIEKLWYLPVSEEDWDASDVELYHSELTKIKNHIIEKCEKDGNLEEINNYAPLDKCLSSRTHRGAPCAAGDSFMSITPTGKLSPCHQMHFNTPESVCGDIWSGVDDEARRFFVQYDDDDFPCQECEHTHCYRCIAHNYDVRGCFTSIVGGVYCEMMLVDMELQNELREYVKEKENAAV